MFSKRLSGIYMDVIILKKSMAKKSKAITKTSVSKKTASKKPSAKKKWSKKATETSNALDLQSEVFKKEDPHQIALSLKRSAEKSKRKKGTPYQSAMSMLNFYINRAGKNLPEAQLQTLEKAKEELRVVFHRGEK
jgi:predicted HNH restriction endonuclease